MALCFSISFIFIAKKKKKKKFCISLFVLKIESTANHEASHLACSRTNFIQFCVPQESSGCIVIDVTITTWKHRVTINFNKIKKPNASNSKVSEIEILDN